MPNIPQDAVHWDSGDWIEWHRSPTGYDATPCSAAAHDPMARLTALHVNMLRAAKSYFQMTGEHLPIYPQIAKVHAAIYCDLPFEGEERSCEHTHVEILALPPYGPDTFVHVDLSKPFRTLIVVRIKDDFTTEAGMVLRDTLPSNFDAPYPVQWSAVTHRI